MEVAARGSGDALTPASSEEEESHSTARLNVLLAILTATCLVIIAFGAWLMGDQYGDRADAVEEGGWFDRTWSLVTIERAEQTGSTRVGEDVGDGTVQALSLASEEEQDRVAAQLEGATKMVNAFLNLQYDEIEANIATVESLSTGPFLKQWTRASEDLARLTRRAQATQTGEVVFSGLVAGDADDATVIVATTGTVANKLTDFEPQARNYRLQLDLELVDGRWLTSDLQYVK